MQGVGYKRRRTFEISKDENVNVDILARICGVLNCDFGDIMEYVPDIEEHKA